MSADRKTIVLEYFGGEYTSKVNVNGGNRKTVKKL